MTLRTKVWHVGAWDEATLSTIIGWNGTRIFRPTLHRVVRAKITDPRAFILAGPGSNNPTYGGKKTWLDRRIVNVIVALDRAMLVRRDDSHIYILSRPGIQACLDAGHITYTWEKEDHDL